MTTGPTRDGQDQEAKLANLTVAKGALDGPVDVSEEVLRDVLGSDVDRELIKFAAGAGGNRRLLTEFALGLAEEGLIKEESGRIYLIERRIPRRVFGFVMRRLGDLSPSSQQLLKVAAALGRTFMLEDVSRMLDRSPAALLSSLDEAMAAEFVVTAGDRLAFQSEFLLAGINESIPVPVRDALRREAMGLSGQRARPYDQRPWMPERPPAPESAPREESVGWCSRAHSLIMNGNAAAGVRVAERILGTPGISDSMRMDAEASLILGYFLLGRDEAEKVSDRVLRERDAESGDVAVMMALTTRSNLLWRAGELAEGLRLGEAAVRHSENVDPVWRLHFLLALAGKLANLREFDRAESLINRAEGDLQALPNPVWTAAASAMRARLYLQSGRIGDARREATLATTAAEPSAVPMLRPLAHSVLSNASFYMGDLSAAVDHLRRAHTDVASQVVLDSVQYAWTELLIAVKKEGPKAAAELLAGKHRQLPTQRGLYIEVPSAAAFLVVLARDLGDRELERKVLATVDQLASDNPTISVIGLTAMHAHALANRAPAALALVIVQSPDPISVALATEELAKLYAAKEPVEGRQGAAPYSEEVGSPLATCWSTLSDMERRIAYLVSVGLTNRQIAKQVHLSQHTVNYHLRKVYKKLGISTRVELVRGAATYTSTAAVYSIDNGAGYYEGAAS